MIASSLPIAIVGIGCRFPGGVTDPASFWRLLSDGVDAIGDIPANRLDVERFFDPRPATPGRMITRQGGFIDGIESFDAAFFGISPREAESLDPQQRLLLETAWEAFEDAGLDARRLEGSDTGVFVGTWTSDFESRLFADPDAVDFVATTGSGRYAASGRLSYAFGLRGPCLTIDTACSSSLVAVHLGVRSLRSGESRLALAAGVNLILQPHISIAYSQSRMMAPDGRCKFGDADGNGYVRSEGAAVVVLKPLPDALADGDRVYAVIRGSAVNNDGRSSGSLGRPSRIGHEELLRRAYVDAGVPPAEVGYVEAHGAGTRAGDPVELGALAAVLSEGRAAGLVCPVGSVKTNIGHTEGAAGLAGLIKSALVLHHGAIPPSLHLTTPNPRVPWDDICLRVVTAPTPWPRAARPRFAGVNAFGISGTNAHVVLEEAPAGPAAVPPAPVRSAELLALSARSLAALRALAGRYAAHLESVPADFRAVCRAAARRRTALEHRVAFVVEDADAAVEALRSFAAGEAAFGARETGDAPPRVAFVCPGQGGQWTGMARQLLAREPVFRAALEQCDAAARAHADWSIVEQLELPPDSPAYRLDRIEVVQPALVAIAIAYAALLRSVGVHPDAVVGHSMGEVAAACIAGVLDVEQAMRVICRRSALMRRTAGRGAMLLTELSFDAARARLTAREPRVVAAVSNGPTTSVLSGDPETIREIAAELDREQIFNRLVNVDVASHSPQMDDVAAALARELEGLTPAAAAAIPIYSTTLARRAVPSEFGADYWARNLRQPVLFATTIAGLIEDGVTAFVELGPHPVLASAVIQTAQSAGRTAIAAACGSRDADEQAALLRTVGDLWSSGVAIDWSAIWPGPAPSHPLPGYPWQRERHWNDEVRLAGQESPRARRRDRQTAQLFYDLEWKPSEPAPADGATRRVLVSGIDRAAAGTLAERLNAAGVAASAPDGDVREMLLAGRWSDLVVFADGPDDVYVPVRALQDVLAASSQARIWLVTRGAFELGQPQAATVASQAAAWGAARAVAEEHPDLFGGLIDLPAGELADADARALAGHLLARDGEDQAAIHDGRRFVLRMVPVAPLRRSRRQPWAPDAAYLITGGLGEIGLLVAAHLAEEGARRIVLLGRTPLPPREHWALVTPESREGRRVAAIRALEARGVAVHLMTADVGDEAELRAVLDRYAAEAWPPIRGVIHAAGALRNELASTMTRATFDAIVRTKVGGAENLDRCLPDLETFVVFSSTAALLPQPGQANYAAANAGADAIARNRRRRGRPALSIEWGVWDGTGLVNSAEGERSVAEMARQGLGGLTPAVALAAFSELTGAITTPAAVTVLAADWQAVQQARQRRLPLLGELVSSAAAEPAAPATSGPGVAALTREQIERVVREVLGVVLRIAPARLDSRKALGSLGLSSLMAMELRNRLEERLGLSLPVTLAWNHPTIEALTTYLSGAGTPAAPDDAALPAAPAAAPGVAAVAAMSDEEAALALLGLTGRESE